MAIIGIDEDSCGRRKQVCPVCGKLIGWRSGMGQHMRWHAGRGEVKEVHVERVAVDVFYRLPDGTHVRG